VPQLPGISRTTAARAFGKDGGLGEVHGGGAVTPPKRSQSGPAPIHPGMRKA
jgi:hypothetical protein